MLEIGLVVTALLCGLVAGLLYGFAVVAMPGIKSLSDSEFIRAFQVMDRVIQNNQPLFLLAWAGSVLALIATVVLGLAGLDGTDRVLLIFAAALYLVGVQLPTIGINVPLNNRLQQVETEGASAAELANARQAFEPRWNRWNRIRTAMAVAATAILITILARI